MESHKETAHPTWGDSVITLWQALGQTMQVAVLWVVLMRF